jgi:hypothetical protein
MEQTKVSINSSGIVIMYVGTDPKAFDPSKVEEEDDE